MKISLALGNPRGLSRQTAWGCLTTNLALPGFGSLVAGRRVGYVQGALYLAAFVITLVAGTRFMLWALANWTRLHDPQADPLAALGEMLHAGRWALAGIAGFLFTWVWALATSLSIINAAKKSDAAKVPPKL